MELALLVAWLVMHAVYRGGVGTYFAVKKMDPPWVANRKERLVNREIRQARRFEALRSRRTLRGFVGRLWGDLWEDANLARDERRAAKAAGRDLRLSWRDRAGQWRQAAQLGMRARLLGLWMRELRQRARQWWDRWMSASRARRQEPGAADEDVVVPEVPDLEPAAAPEAPPTSQPQQVPAPQNVPTAPDVQPKPVAPPGPGPNEPTPTGRPQLRAVPNPPTQPVNPPTGPDTQGAQVTAPAEITNVQSLRGFAEKVVVTGNQEWPAMLENAEQQIGGTGLNNDPDITKALGQIREAAAAIAAGGAALAAALPKHEAAAEQVSGLGSAAASKIEAYQNQ